MHFAFAAAACPKLVLPHVDDPLVVAGRLRSRRPHSVLQACGPLGGRVRPVDGAQDLRWRLMSDPSPPVTAAPAFTLHDADRKNVSLARLCGSARDRLLLSRRDDRRLYHPGGRLHRGNRGTRRSRIRVSSASPRTAPTRSASSGRKQSIAFPLLSDPGQGNSARMPTGHTARSNALRKLIEGVIRSTFVVDVDAKGSGRYRRRAVQREGQGACRQSSNAN